MPAAYAHYRFAKKAASVLPEEVRKYPELYYAGCHGPDPLFYYSPFFHHPVDALADWCHNMAGAVLLGAAAARIGGAESGRAYLFGLLTHYCLDSICHPYVNALAQAGACNHTELETEFDRFLLARDGEAQPHKRNLGEYLRLDRRFWDTAAACYPGLTGRQYGVSLRNMALCTRILSGKTVLRRPLLEVAMPHFSGNVRYQLMTKTPNPRVAHLEDALYNHYCRAEERLPAMAAQLAALLRHGTPLGGDFAHIFG